MTITVEQLPQRVDLRLYAGDTFSLIVTITQGGAPLDVSGDELVAAMDDGNVFDVDMTDAATGRVVLSIVPKPFARRWDLEDTTRGQTLVGGKVCVVDDVSGVQP